MIFPVLFDGQRIQRVDTPYLNLGTSKTIFSLRERIGSNADDK